MISLTCRFCVKSSCGSFPWSNRAVCRSLYCLMRLFYKASRRLSVHAAAFLRLFRLSAPHRLTSRESSGALIAGTTRKRCRKFRDGWGLDSSNESQAQLRGRSSRAASGWTTGRSQVACSGRDRFTPHVRAYTGSLSDQPGKQRLSIGLAVKRSWQLGTDKPLRVRLYDASAQPGRYRPATFPEGECAG